MLSRLWGPQALLLDSTSQKLLLKEPWKRLLQARGNWRRHGEGPDCPRPHSAIQTLASSAMDIPLIHPIASLLVYIPQQNASFESGSNTSLSLAYSVLSTYYILE